MLLLRYTNAKDISKKSKTKNVKSLPDNENLIYLAKSPDYCTKDDSLGSFGTVGRYSSVIEYTNECFSFCFLDDVTSHQIAPIAAGNYAVAEDIGQWWKKRSKGVSVNIITAVT